LKDVDMVVMACPIEAFGRVTIEAMAAGRPVIGINAGGTAEIVLPGKTGLLINNDQKELSQAMLELAGNPQKAVEMGLAGRQRAEALFSIPNMINSIMEMYRGVLKK
jgi:glycosyltransferase involved in cell wall biosynthesis